MSWTSHFIVLSIENKELCGANKSMSKQWRLIHSILGH